MIILSILFFVTAILYASVGFGGGSTYLALLLLWGVPYFIFPVVALTCNIIVVSGNCFNYIRTGNLNLKLLIPYLIGSIPLAFIGGSLPIEKKIFELLLFLLLTIAGILLLFNFKSYDDKEKSYRKVPLVISILIGGVLGFISGIVGIGGGMAIDVAKYISWKLNKNLVSIPTILSVDAFTTPAAGVRVNHDVEYLGIASPNPLIIDYDLLRSAPKELNIAGVGDLFSIHTASFDWQYAHSKGKSEYPLVKMPLIMEKESLILFIIT